MNYGCIDITVKKKKTNALCVFWVKKILAEIIDILLVIIKLKYLFGTFLVYMHEQYNILYSINKGIFCNAVLLFT